MKQIRVHGRGGQGVVTASELIAIAGFNDGNEAQAFPSFGVERTGAPIEAFTRIDKKPIITREQIYKPDILVILDATLLESVDVAHGASKNTIAVINTTQKVEELNIDIPQKNIFTVDATKIALEVFGRNISNTTILGALAKVTGVISLDGLKKAVKQKFSEKGEKIINLNIKAIEKAYKSI